MDFKWFYDELKDEIEGATTYIKVAIEFKAMDEKMSKTFYEMATQEAEHARKIFDMAMDYYNQISEAWSEKVPEFIVKIKEDIVNCYTKKSVEIKLLLSMYKD